VSTQAISVLTPEQYLEIERKNEYKSEYIDGAMLAMANASRNHARIVTNSVLQLGPQLRGGPCEVVSTDLRLHIKAVRVYTYPDIMVICGTPGLTDEEENTAPNPRFIAEVLSDSTKNYDQGEKFRFYRTIPGFSDYLLIAQDSIRAQHYQRRSDSAWILREFTSELDKIQLDSIECRLDLGALYERVVFGETA
jgi:Uma2 family endonuclease